MADALPPRSPRDQADATSLLAEAEHGILGYLSEKRSRGQLAENFYADAVANVLPNLRAWYVDPAIDALSPHLKTGIREAVREGRWEQLVNAYLRQVKFGTGGIRALMAFDKASVEALAREGLDAPILKGPNTINDIVVLQAAYGVARYLVDQYGKTSGGAARAKVVVGFDSRVAGAAFAKTVAELCLAEGLAVYLFDEAVPYPEVTFAIPHLSADMGIFISASHNDYRYNGFKISGPNGAQIPYRDRDVILEKYIKPAKPADIRLARLETAPKEVLARLHDLGGGAPLPDHRYHGCELIDVHSAHVDHIKSFLLRKDPAGAMEGGADLDVVFAAFNGSGRRAVPRILSELGCRRIHRIASLDTLNGLFPAFRSDPGWEQQPDPGDPRAADIALKQLEKDRREATYIPWSQADLLIGTDPDADRCGVILKPPKDLAALLGRPTSLRYGPTHMLVPADDMWTLVLWYRLQFEIERHGRVLAPETRFVALSHTTSDMIAKLAAKHGLGVCKTWVGFGWLSAGVAHAWSDVPIPRIEEGRASDAEEKCDRVFFDTTGMLGGRRKVNVATLEQSNGFSILGGPPQDPDRQMGAGGHVRDKDGTFAALLVAEIAAYAKRHGTDCLSLLTDHVYADPDVGLFVNYYEPDPLDGEYPGIEGDTKKKAILEKVEGIYRDALRGGAAIGGRKVTAARKYWTGKYDATNWPGFPDEGIRFYFGTPLDHLTIRPSGTTNSLRFHVQFHAGPVGRDRVWRRRLELEAECRELVTEIRERIGAPRAEGSLY